MDLRAHIDFETRSTVDLRKTGVYVYAEHPSTGVWCLSWALEDADTGTIVERGCWTPNGAEPAALLAHVATGGVVVNHNATFERTIWNNVLLPRYGLADWPALTLEQQDCTMARAAALALPMQLGMLSNALKMPVVKDKDGHALMLRMCKPRLVKNGVISWHEDHAMIQRLLSYCDNDVDTELHIDRMLPALSDRELAVWRLDQIINERGVLLDVASVTAAVNVASEALDRANARMWFITDGEVQKCTQVARLAAWVNKRGVECKSLAKGGMEELIVTAKAISDPEVEEALELRRAAAKGSVAKFTAMKATACEDGRVRGSLQYHGATTGRWAGRGMQPQNFPRVDPERDGANVNMAIELLNLGVNPREVVDAIELLVGENGKAPKTLDVLSKCLRAMLVSKDGTHFVGGDFSNIEGRVNAWLAGEYWKVDAFRAFDEKRGPDLYLLTAAEINGILLTEVTKAQRQGTGKVPELALGYQGGVGAFINMAANYGVRPESVAAVARTTASETTWKETHAKFEGSRSYGLDVETWTGIRCVVDRWRAANANIVQGWWDLQDAAISAVSTPGVIYPVYGGRVRYLATGGFLLCSLPSKRTLAYAQPRLKETEHNGRKRMQVEYDALDTLSNQWGAQVLYGGEQCNHVVQGTARDIMVDAMMRAEAADFPVVLTVHDELLCEVPSNRADPERLRQIMATLPDWAEGLPLAAATWRDVRYVK